MGNYLRAIRPILLGWSERYDHLREVTYDDIVAVAATLAADGIAQTATAATTPALRLAVALAAVHAARAGAIRALRLDDIDLGNMRITISGLTRPLDDLTHQLLLGWLGYRAEHWPNTANPHVIISRQTAMETGPVSSAWAASVLAGHGATLEALRIDRQLEEALTHGPDPLHLAAVFGLNENTAIRYANAARQLLTSPIENSGDADRRS